MRYALHLSYFGKNYAGWQRQSNAFSVQEDIEKALSTILKETIKITGCGRTDTGVHAYNFYAHFDYPNDLPKNLVPHANAITGKDISLHSIFQVDSSWNARFSACSRSYRYYISLDKNPFMREFSWHVPYQLDLSKMRSAAEVLFYYNDFTSFARLHGGQKTNICTIKDVNLRQINNMLIFEISADRFLRNMVRAIVGTLVDIGRGHITKNDFIKIIEAKDRSSAGPSAPSQGLFLAYVNYNPPLNSAHIKNMEDFPYL